MEPGLEQFVRMWPPLAPASLMHARDAAFRQYGEVEHLLGYGGRCTVSLNPRTLDESGEPIGMLGDLSLPQDAAAAQALLTQARNWLQARGCARVQASLTRHTWYPFRVVTDGMDAFPRLSGEPWNAPNLADQLDSYGFEAVAWYASTWTMDSRDQIDSAHEKLAHLYDQGYVIRAFDPERAAQELARIHEVTLRAFAAPRNYLFHPISLEEFQLVLGPAMGRIDPGLVLLGIAPDGSTAGYIYTTREGDGAASIKTLAVAREHQGVGLARALTSMAHVACRERGIKRVIHALMRADGPSLHISAYGKHQLFRRYAVFELRL